MRVRRHSEPGLCLLYWSAYDKHGFVTKIQRRLFSITSMFLVVAVLGGCSSGESSNSGESSGTEQTSDTEGKKDSAIDEDINASVKCTITDLDYDDVSDIQEDGTTALITIKGQSYFYYTESVTVTNYSDDAANIYVAYRLADENGKVFESRNFREIVQAGETITIDDNRIVQPATDIVVKGDSVAKETAIQCPVVEARISGL